MNNENTCYVLGPMTGYHDENRPAFKAATEILRRANYDVISPDELDEIDPVEITWENCLRRDLAYLRLAGFGVALPGWEKSRGARLEATILHALGAPIFALVDGQLKRIPDASLPTIVING
jgi:hypothetical protein